MLALPSFVAVAAGQLLAALVVVLLLVAAVALHDVLAIFDVPTFVDQPFQVVVVAAVGDVDVVTVDVVVVAAGVDTLDVDDHKPVGAVAFEPVTVQEFATDLMAMEYAVQVFAPVLESSQAIYSTNGPAGHDALDGNPFGMKLFDSNSTGNNSQQTVLVLLLATVLKSLSSMKMPW